MPIKIAIQTKIYPNPNEVPTSQHIAHLFGGDTVILCRRRHATLKGDKPAFVTEDFPSTTASRLVNLPENVRNWATHRTTRVLAGRGCRAMQEFLREQKAEAILVEMGHESPQVLGAVRATGLPLFVYFRGYDATGYLKPSRHLSRRIAVYRKVLTRSAGIIAVSQFLLDELARHGITHPNSHVIPSGVDTARFTPAEKVPGLVLAAGRFIDKKAPETTIRAFAAAAEGIDGAHLEMIGDGPLLDRCRALVAELGAQNRISLPGRQSHDAVRDRLRQAGIFVQHSVRAPNGDQEGAPTVIQEAMAAGACILSTRHAGIPDLVDDGVHGFLVDEHDETAFAGRLRHALLNPQDCAGMGRAGRERAVRDFDRTRLYRRTEAVITQGITAHAPAISTPRRGAA